MSAYRRTHDSNVGCFRSVFECRISCSIRQEKFTTESRDGAEREIVFHFQLGNSRELPTGFRRLVPFCCESTSWLLQPFLREPLEWRLLQLNPIRGSPLEPPFGHRHWSRQGFRDYRLRPWRSVISCQLNCSKTSSKQFSQIGWRTVSISHRLANLQVPLTSNSRISRFRQFPCISNEKRRCQMHRLLPKSCQLLPSFELCLVRFCQYHAPRSLSPSTLRDPRYCVRRRGTLAEACCHRCC